MELRHICYFLSVASCQSFTRAAETVHVSQPSLSVQIVALEEELGTRLFDRLGRKVVLTQAGELFRPHAEHALRELEHATQAVQDLHGAKRGRFVVGTLSMVNSYLIPPYPLASSSVIPVFNCTSMRSPQPRLSRHSWPTDWTSASACFLCRMLS